MTRLLTLVILITFQLSFISSATAQQTDIPNLKRSVEILSTVLREGLELDDSPGLFGISENRVDGVYLQGQGVLIEIQTPLAKRRVRIKYSALASSLYRLPDRTNPFAVIVQQDTPVTNRTRTFTSLQNSTTDMYQSFVDEIQAVDFGNIFDSSIRQANSAARSLLELGQLEQENFNELQQELAQMRRELYANREELMSGINELRQNVNNGTTEPLTVPEDIEASLRDGIENFRTAADDFKSAAADQAENLSERYEAAKLAYENEWQVEVAEMESNLYGLLCDYGATLRDLPEDERLTVVFADLGISPESDNRSDRIHVLTKSDLARCQSGRIDPAELQERSFGYDY